MGKIFRMDAWRLSSITSEHTRTNVFALLRDWARGAMDVCVGGRWRGAARKHHCTNGVGVGAARRNTTK